MTVCEISTKMYICCQDEKIGGLSSFSSFGLKADDSIDNFDFMMLVQLDDRTIYSFKESVNLQFDLEL